MKKTLLLTAFMALFLVAWPPAHAETDALDAATTAVAAAEPGASCATGLAGTVWTLPDAGAQGGCTAQCWDGSQLQCEGTYCTKWDSACYSEQGRCYGSESGWLYCPTCATSCPGKPCDYYDGQSCTTSVTCYGEPPGCSSYTCNCFGGQYRCP